MSERTELRGQRKASKGSSRKTVNLILAIVIALVLWVYVISGINPTTTDTIRNVPVQLVNVDSLTARGLAISGDAEYTVDVVIEGKRADILNVTSDVITAEADVFGYSIGENYVTVMVTVPSAVSLVEVRSTRVVVNIEELVAQTKPIEILYTGDIPEGYEPGALVLSPAEIEVSGARSIVESVTSLQVVVPAENLSVDGSTVRSQVDPVNYGGIYVDNVRLSSSYVEIYSELLRLKEVEVNVVLEGQLEETLTPVVSGATSVMIKGPRAVVDELETVDSAPVSLEDLESGAEVALTLELPEGVELANGAAAPSVTISIEEIRTEEFLFEVSEIDVENLSAGENMEIVSGETGEIRVTASGTAAMLEALSREDISLFVDMEGLEPGTQTVEIRIRCERELLSITAAPPELQVTFTAAEEGDGEEAAESE
ncbi:MAG: CdaR family protein [Bacillota bacterium]|nr:CdaR family protein [Bacillota bacterium]